MGQHTIVFLLNKDSIKLYASDTWKWSDSFSDYSAEDFSCNLILKKHTNMQSQLGELQTEPHSVL